MAKRQDIRRLDLIPASVHIPRELADACIRVGGTNPFEEPMFRVVLAQDRVIPAAGMWADWGNTPVEDRGSLGIKQVVEMLKQGKSHDEIQEFVDHYMSRAPKRVTTGMIQRRLYPFEGFILEKWKPADSFGSPLVWDQFRFAGQSALGPYPAHGEYELCAGPTPYLPTSDQITDAIRETFHVIDSRPGTPTARRFKTLCEMSEWEAWQEKENLARLTDVVTEDTQLYKTVSLGAGRARNEMAKKAGIKEHYGN